MNLNIVFILPWFSSSANQSIIFIKTLPSIIFLMKSNILSKIPLTGFNIFSADFFNTVNPLSNLFSALLLLSLSADTLSFSNDFSSNFCSSLIVAMRSSSFWLISSTIFSVLSPTGDCTNFCIAPPGAFTIAPARGNPLPPVGATVADFFFDNTLLTNCSNPILSFLFLNPSFLSCGVSCCPSMDPCAASSSLYFSYLSSPRNFAGTIFPPLPSSLMDLRRSSRSM